MSTEPYSTMLPPYITSTFLHDLGDHAQIVGDHDDRRCRRRLHLVHELENLRLNRDIERGRRLVGDQHLRIARQRHRDHHALAHAARKLVRIIARSRCSAREFPPGAASRSPWRAMASRAAEAGSRRSLRPICSPTVSTGFKRVIGSWKIIAMSWPRILRISASLFVASPRP